MGRRSVPDTARTTRVPDRAGDGRSPVLTPLPVPVAATPRDPLGFPGYLDALEGTGHDPAGEAAVEVGTTRLAGLPVVVAQGRFDLHGGSMGAAHGERVATAMRFAVERRWPFIAVTASGGARMQEGMVALTQLTRAAEGIRRLREAGVPVLTLLTHPTTGGVLVAYGALGDVVLASSGALVGFAGPRVVETVTGAAVTGSHTAHSAAAAGLVDAVVSPEQAWSELTAWVRLVHPEVRHGPLPALEQVAEPVVELTPWEAVQRARRPDRPTAREVAGQVVDELRELNGDRAGGRDPAVLSAVARLGEHRLVLIATDRLAGGPHADRQPRPGAAGYRQLARAVALAGRWELPVVALIDTPGADPSSASEQAGVAGAIGELFVTLLDVTTPTVAVVTGEGGSGGALALGATDRVLAQDDSVFEVIAPEAAATILHRDPTRAEQVASRLAPTAQQLRALGVVDRIVPGPTTFSPATAASALRAALTAELHALHACSDRLARRRRRYGPATP